MPKGQPGCFTCGSATARVVQIWLRDYDRGNPVPGKRKQETVDSVTRSFCVPCADMTFDQLLRTMPDRSAKLAAGWPYHGCLICAKRPDGCIQVWMSMRLDGDRTTVRSVTRSFCDEDGANVYDAMGQILDADSYRSSVKRVSPSNLLGARRRRHSGMLSPANPNGVVS